jgi:hypothetical protein
MLPPKRHHFQNCFAPSFALLPYGPTDPICTPPLTHLRFLLSMITADLRCDGCGQPASPEHIARRLQRLEWTTRYRPVHIGALLLGAAAPQNDLEFIYCPSGQWKGEAQILLAAAGIASDGKPPEAILAEFQRGGFFVTHVLECPLENVGGDSPEQLIANRLPAVLARIRRSLKPKRLAPISESLEQFLPALASGGLPCTILLDQERPFVLDGNKPSEAAARLRDVVRAQSFQASTS